MAVQHHLQPHVEPDLAPQHAAAERVRARVQCPSLLVLQLPDELSVGRLCQRGVEVECAADADIGGHGLEQLLAGHLLARPLAVLEDVGVIPRHAEQVETRRLGVPQQPE